MNYELAKALKEAGFPQRDTCSFTDCRHGMDVGVSCAYTPTLEELIEASRNTGFLFKLEETITGKWRAKAYGSKLGWKKGLTPKDAVANLYLALHAK